VVSGLRLIFKKKAGPIILNCCTGWQKTVFVRKQSFSNCRRKPGVYPSRNNQKNAFTEPGSYFLTKSFEKDPENVTKTPLYLVLKNNIPYRNLWIGTTGRSLGGWIYRITLITYAVRTLPQGVGIAWILLASGLPAVILAPWTGPLIDRFDKRLLLIMVNLSLATLTLILFAIVHLRHVVVLDFIMIALLSSGSAFTNPARTALTTQLVSREHLPNMRGFEVVTSGVIMVMGALIGGFIVTLASVSTGFLLTALSYLWYALWSVTLPQPARADHPDHRREKGLLAYLKDLREGLRIAWVNPVAMLVLGLGISWGIIGGSYYVLLSYVGSGALTANGTGIGLFYALDGVGYMIGGGVAGQWFGTHDKTSRMAMIAAYLLQSVFLVFFARSSHLDMAIVWLLVMRIASGIVVTLDGLMLQRNVPQQYQGRIISLHDGLYGLLMQGSYLIGGWGIMVLGAPMLGTILAALSAIIGIVVVVIVLRMGLFRDTAIDNRLNRQI
jgi:MFS family permease